MTKTILVCGYGPGISNAVAERFGREGFAVALAARNADRVSAGVKALEAKGIRAAGFPTDLGDPTAARALVGKVRETLGPITALCTKGVATLTQLQRFVTAHPGQKIVVSWRIEP